MGFQRKGKMWIEMLRCGVLDRECLPKGGKYKACSRKLRNGELCILSLLVSQIRLEG